jgi:hypothetical protein
MIVDGELQVRRRAHVDHPVFFFDGQAHEIVLGLVDAAERRLRVDAHQLAL